MLGQSCKVGNGRDGKFSILIQKNNKSVPYFYKENTSCKDTIQYRTYCNLLPFCRVTECYNCDQRGHESCNSGVCNCKVIRHRHFMFALIPQVFSPSEYYSMGCLYLFPLMLVQMNVEGQYCSTCKTGAFHLSQENKDGCLSCFCMGVTQQCSSSTYYRDLVRL